MKKKIIEITTIKELMEMSSMGGNAIQGAPVSNVGSKKPKGKDMRKDLQTEMMIRNYIKNKIKKQLWEQRKKC